MRTTDERTLRMPLFNVIILGNKCRQSEFSLTIHILECIEISSWFERCFVMSLLRDTLCFLHSNRFSFQSCQFMNNNRRICCLKFRITIKNLYQRILEIIIEKSYPLLSFSFERFIITGKQPLILGSTKNKTCTRV